MWSLEAKNAQVSFKRGSLPALSFPDLSVSLGAPLAVLGRNGAGKTTFLRMLAGLITLQSGYVAWHRVEGGCAQPNVGYLPASFGLIPELSVEENLRACCADMVRDNALDHSIKLMQLSRLLQKRPGDLSLGEGQRVRFAIAISRAPDVYLLDEPVSNMDIDATILALDAITTVNSAGSGVVLVTHDLATVESLCPNLVILDEGRVVYQGAQQAFVERCGGGTFPIAYRRFMGSGDVLGTK